MCLEVASSRHRCRHREAGSHVRPHTCYLFKGLTVVNCHRRSSHRDETAVPEIAECARDGLAGSSDEFTNLLVSQSISICEQGFSACPFSADRFKSTLARFTGVVEERPRIGSCPPMC